MDGVTAGNGVYEDIFGLGLSRDKELDFIERMVKNDYDLERVVEELIKEDMM